MRLRNAVPIGVVVLLLGLLAGFAWLSQHPDDPRWVRAESWPVVGPLVARLHAAYLSPEEGSRTQTEEAPREIFVPAVPTPPPPAGTPVGSKTLWVSPGTPLRAAPRVDAEILGAAEDYEELPYTERLPAPPLPGEHLPAHWYKVWPEGRPMWLRWVEAAPGEPPLGREPQPVRPLEAMAPDPERLTLALDLLGTDRSSGRLGPYVLYTDVTDPYVLQRLSAVAVQIETVYQRRFGVRPVGEPAEAVVLFAHQEDYRNFQNAWSNLEGLPAAGHAGAGIVAFFVEGRQYNEMISTLVHELVHLLNRRALGPVLPPWLDEGLAEDLTWAEIDATGRVQPGTWGGDRVEWSERDKRRGGVIVGDVVTGGLAIHRTLPRFAETLDRGLAVPLDELVDLSWEEFVRTGGELHYLESGLLVRFLLDDRELNPRFRRFLAETAEGKPLTPERFRETLGMSWEEIETRFSEWVREEASGA
jgi:hypothetical protein